MNTGLVYISQCKSLLAPQTVPPCHARVYKLGMRRRARVVVVVVTHSPSLSNTNSRISTNFREREEQKKTETFGAYFYTLFATSDDDISPFRETIGAAIVFVDM